MSDKCQMVVFSNKAYNAIIRESFDKDPVETGGILLGHILDNGVWIVMEVLPPGIKCIFERAYFEYDDAFVNYLAQSVANQYKIPLELLGLWHRHPGSMDVFSSTDDGTNTTFALQNPSGVISGLVNIDPQFRLTMYHMENPRNVVRQYARPNYERIDVEVGDDIIPEEYFQLKYYDGEGSNLNPFVERSHTRMSRSVRTEGAGNRTINEEPLDIRNTIQGNLNREDENYVEPQDENPSWMNDLTRIWEILKKNKIMSLIALILVIVSIFSFKTAIEWCKSGVETVISWVSDDDKEEPCISEDEVTLKVGEDFSLIAKNVTEKDNISWRSSDTELATVSKKGKVSARKEGDVEVTLTVNGKDVGVCKIEIEAKSRPNYKLSAEEMTLEVNSNGGLTIEGVEDASKIKWESTDNTIATVDNGVVTTLDKEGPVTIIANVEDQSLSCNISVIKSEKVASEVPSFEIKPQSNMNPDGGWLNIDFAGGKLLLYIKDGYNAQSLNDVSWESSNVNVANVECPTTNDICQVKFIGIGKTDINLLYKGHVVDTYKLELKSKK